MRLRLIPRALKQKRLENVWTQEELAKRAALDPATISLYETGQRNGTITTIQTLARVLGCDPRELCEIVEDDAGEVEPAGAVEGSA